MIRTSLKVETVLEYLLPGIIFVGGNWYLFKPFISHNFPTLSMTIPQSTSMLSIKFLILSFLSLVFGFLFKHLSDIAIVVTNNDAANTNKTNKWLRKAFIFSFRIYSPYIWKSADPRVEAINRYLNSERKAIFLDMSKSWAHTTLEKLKLDNEKINVHQHIIVHQKVLSDNLYNIIEEQFNEVLYIGALFLSFSMLFPLSIFSFLLNQIYDNQTIVYDTSAHAIISAIIYFFAFISAYVLKRRFRNFSSQALTLGIHAYMIEKNKN